MNATREPAPSRGAPIGALLGAALFFVIAPGMVAGWVPWWITRWRVGPPLLGWSILRPLGALLVLAGLAALVECFARFVLDGLGTPAPVYQTRRLVVTGLYRYVRNPMYIAVTAIILGQALLFGHLGLLEYALGVWLAFNLFVLFYEEPTLQGKYGPEYAAYRAAVRRWWPRLRGWTP
jgi:protein-S-isoprenylcysteine O-methyltransferase Ste14